MVTLSAIHYVYIIMTILILAVLLFKKEIVIPCIVGILAIGFVYSKDILKSIQILNNALIQSTIELLSIIVVIALVVAMSKAMTSVGADELMIRPVRKIIRTKSTAFFGLGLAMLIVSWLIWPSPAVALIGALLLPVAGEVGLPAIWAAVAMNIFGHGGGLSSDFFIQGAPAISAEAAGLDVTEVMKASVPLWAIMLIVTVFVATFLMIRDTKKNPINGKKNTEYIDSYVRRETKKPVLGIVVAILIPVAFLLDVFFMVKFSIAGGDATALVAGTALILTCIITIANEGLSNALEKTTDYVKEGFIFAIRIFAPVIVIAAFFFMGSEGFAKSVLGEHATGLLNDIGMWITSKIPVSRISVAAMETGLGVITGLDGSGFSGLPLVGSVAQAFSAGTKYNTAVLAALGQITTVWVGGGTIIPWGVIPVAAICGVKPADLARKNLIPVICGLVAMTIGAILLM